MTTETQTTALETLVGEDKKFKDVEALAKGKVEADAFIVTLQNQIQTLAEELKNANITADRKTALENLMSSLTNTTKPPVQPTGNQPQEPNNQTAGLSHDDVVKLLEARDKAAAETRNLQTAYAPVRKLYGEKTDEVLDAKAKELGMSREALDNLAKTSPQAFVSVVGVNKTDNSTRPMASHSSVSNLGGGDSGPDGVRNKAYYDGVKQKMGAKAFAFDAKLQVQLHKDMAALGDAWDS
jgi:hypothetical protein